MLRYFPADKRRRFAPLLLVVGLMVVGKLAYDDMPRDESLRFELPGPNVAALRVIYSAGDDFYGGFERRFPNGAPELVTHSPQLAPGRYDVAIELADTSGKTTRLKRSFQVPADGTLRISLRSEP